MATVEKLAADKAAAERLAAEKVAALKPAQTKLAAAIAAAQKATVEKLAAERIVAARVEAEQKAAAERAAEEAKRKAAREKLAVFEKAAAEKAPVRVTRRLLEQALSDYQLDTIVKNDAIDTKALVEWIKNNVNSNDIKVLYAMQQVFTYLQSNSSQKITVNGILQNMSYEWESQREKAADKANFEQAKEVIQTAISQDETLKDMSFRSDVNYASTDSKISQLVNNPYNGMYPVASRQWAIKSALTEFERIRERFHEKMRSGNKAAVIAELLAGTPAGAALPEPFGKPGLNYEMLLQYMNEKVSAAEAQLKEAQRLVKLDITKVVTDDELQAIKAKVNADNSYLDIKIINSTTPKLPELTQGRVKGNPMEIMVLLAIATPSEQPEKQIGWMVFDQYRQEGKQKEIEEALRNLRYSIDKAKEAATMYLSLYAAAAGIDLLNATLQLNQREIEQLMNILFNEKHAEFTSFMQQQLTKAASDSQKFRQIESKITEIKKFLGSINKLTTEVTNIRSSNINNNFADFLKALDPQKKGYGLTTN